MEEKIAFLIFGTLIGWFSLGIFGINWILGLLLSILTVGFWWTLFFVFFGK